MGARVKATQDKPWHYTDCGLDNVWLVGIEVETDPKTGEAEPIIPQIRDLHDCIFATLLRKPGPLAGPEVRYLRRHLGWTQAGAAERLGFNSPQYFSELERRETAFSDVPVDFVWRLLCVNAFEAKAKGARKKQAKTLKDNLLRKTENLLARMHGQMPAGIVRMRHTGSDGGRFWRPILRAA